MLIRDNEIDFSNDVFVAQLMKEVVNSLCEKLFEHMIQVNVN